jgi:hypothetical protein
MHENTPIHILFEYIMVYHWCRSIIIIDTKTNKYYLWTKVGQIQPTYQNSPYLAHTSSISLACEFMRSRLNETGQLAYSQAYRIDQYINKLFFLKKIVLWVDLLSFNEFWQIINFHFIDLFYFSKSFTNEYIYFQPQFGNHGINFNHMIKFLLKKKDYQHHNLHYGQYSIIILTKLYTQGTKLSTRHVQHFFIYYYIKFHKVRQIENKPKTINN